MGAEKRKRREQVLRMEHNGRQRDRQALWILDVEELLRSGYRYIRRAHTGGRPSAGGGSDLSATTV